MKGIEYILVPSIKPISEWDMLLYIGRYYLVTIFFDGWKHMEAPSFNKGSFRDSCMGAPRCVLCNNALHRCGYRRQLMEKYHLWLKHFLTYLLCLPSYIGGLICIRGAEDSLYVRLVLHRSS